MKKHPKYPGPESKDPDPHLLITSKSSLSWNEYTVFHCIKVILKQQKLKISNEMKLSPREDIKTTRFILTPFFLLLITLNSAWFKR